MRKTDNPLTPEIIIETLKRSSLKTVLVEGRDDVQIYRKIEKRIGIRNVNFLPCGGKPTLLRVFEKRNEYNSRRIMFVADKDTWVFSNVPKKYKDVFFSKGYCIENDLFEDGCELLLGLIDADELIRFREIIKNLSKWFAFEIEQIIEKGIKSPFSNISILATSVMEKGKNDLCYSFLKERNCLVYKDTSMSEEIIKDYKLKLRGKYIFQIFEKIFQNRPKKSIKYHRKQLFDMCFVEGTRNEAKESNMNYMISEIAKFARK